MLANQSAEGTQHTAATSRATNAGGKTLLSSATCNGSTEDDEDAAAGGCG